MPKTALARADAVFCHRNAIPPDEPARRLKPNPREVFCDALDYVAELDEKA